MDRPASGADERRFVVFSVTWAFAHLFHLPQHFPFTWTTATFAGFAAIAVLAPRAVWPLVAMAAARMLDVWAELPLIQTNDLVSFYVDGTIVLAAAQLALRHRRLPAPAELGFAIAGAVRIELVLLWFFAAFHKINAAFFDLARTRARDVYAMWHGLLPMLPRMPRFFPAVVVAFEMSIPFLLLSRRTAFLGIAMTFLFAYPVGIGGIYQFGSVLMALSVVFLDDDVLQRFVEAPPIRALGSRRLRVARVIAVLAFVAVGIFIGHKIRSPGAGRGADSYVYFHAAKALWAVYALPLAALVAWGVARRRAAMTVPRPFAGMGPVIALVPIVIFVNELLPYVGVKDYPIFSMYTDIATGCEGGNHLLMPRREQGWLATGPVVTVLSIDKILAGWAPPGKVIPYGSLAAIARASEHNNHVPLVATYDGEGGQPVELGGESDALRDRSLIHRWFTDRWFYHDARAATDAARCP